MASAPAQLGEVLGESRRGGAKLYRDGEEYVVVAPCSRCREEQQHRSWVRDGRPNDWALGLACMLMCRRCGDEHKKDALEKQTAEAYKLRVSAADMPPSLRGLSFEDMLDGTAERRRRAIESARKWAEQPQSYVSPGLYIYGSVGVGKTRLAATAAWRRLEHSPIRWVSVAVLMAKLSAAWGDADRRQALQVLTGKGAVVLDDLDKVNPSENARAQLYTAINERIEARAPMIVTANSKLSQLADRLGEAIVSRLAGHCTQLELDGPDRRLELVPGGKD